MSSRGQSNFLYSRFFGARPSASEADPAGTMRIASTLVADQRLNGASMWSI